MRMLRELIVLSGVAIATAAFPAVAQQGQEPAPTEDHNAHHGGMDQQSGQQAPGGMTDKESSQQAPGGMMGKDGQGMMGQGGMMGKDGQGMMGQDKMSGGCPMMGGMMGKGGGMMMHSRPAMEARLAYLKADLEITEAQMEAWDAYADAIRARAGSMKDKHADMMEGMKEGSALARMDARIKATEAKLESLKALKPPTEALYAVLTEAQKDKADKLLGGGCPMM